MATEHEIRKIAKEEDDRDRQLIEVIVDQTIPDGKVGIGGSRLLHAPSDMQLGIALRTKLIRVSTKDQAKRMRKWIREQTRYELECDQ
jgi:predicted nucleotidyltransferase